MSHKTIERNIYAHGNGFRVLLTRREYGVIQGGQFPSIDLARIQRDALEAQYAARTPWSNRERKPFKSMAQRMAEKRAARRALGVCVECGSGSPEPGHAYCPDCLQFRRLKYATKPNP